MLSNVSKMKKKQMIVSPSPESDQFNPPGQQYLEPLSPNEVSGTPLGQTGQRCLFSKIDPSSSGRSVDSKEPCSGSMSRGSAIMPRARGARTRKRFTVAVSVFVTITRGLRIVVTTINLVLVRYLVAGCGFPGAQLL